MDRVVVEALKPYKKLYVQVDDMEEGVNDRL